YANFEVVGFEVKHLRQGLNITVGTSSLFQSPELEVFNVRADEAVSLEYHHYLVDSPDKGIYVGGGYFVRGNVFGKNTDTLGELTRGGAESTKPGVNVPFYAIFGEKIGFGDLFFFDMHVRVNERISPSIFFGFRF
ncbi:MAG: hypothetical protein ACE5FU_10355, partial [Nitrospinota bacterium]